MQGAAGITTAAPYVAGQLGQGTNRLVEDALLGAGFHAARNFVHTVK
jgi:hypothetical protein